MHRSTVSRISRPVTSYRLDPQPSLRDVVDKLNRIAEAVDGLARQEPGSETGSAAPSCPLAMDAGPAASELSTQLSMIMSFRERRRSILDYDFFGEPAWDMLLDLTEAHMRGKDISMTSLCVASHAPQSTAFRYIQLMLNAGLIEREDDPLDRRRINLRLTKRGLASMQELLS
jgi:predicted transcriptional regulator